MTANSQARNRAQALARAAESGDGALVRELLAAGAPADARLEGGATALMRASARGYADVARLLLDAGADVNARRGDGFTPLVLAVFFGHEEVVRLLLERGADASSRTRLGVTARGWAASRGFNGISELLKDAPETHAPTPESAVVALPSDGVAPSPGLAASGVAAEVKVGRASSGEIAGAVAGVSTHRAAAAREPQTFKAQAYEQQFYPPTRGFLRSWQAAVGVVLLVAAGGVAGFAVWQNKRGGARVGPQPTPAAAVPPPAALPAPSASVDNLAGQPSPTPPFVDAQGGALMPGAVIIEPYPYAQQPALVQPDASSPAGSQPSSVPTVVSESDDAASDSAPRREPRDARTEGAEPVGRRDEERRADDARPEESGRRDRPSDSEVQAPPPRPPAPDAAPSATPRRRVIQWPP